MVGLRLSHTENADQIERRNMHNATGPIRWSTSGISCWATSETRSASHCITTRPLNALQMSKTSPLRWCNLVKQAAWARVHTHVCHMSNTQTQRDNGSWQKPFMKSQMLIHTRPHFFAEMRVGCMLFGSVSTKTWNPSRLGAVEFGQHHPHFPKSQSKEVTASVT